jgi:uncharacterized protein DUF6498
MADARWRGVAAALAGSLLRKLAKSERSWLAVAALVLINLLPVTAVRWRGWQPGDVLAAYWLESIAIGFWSCLKIRTARGPDRASIIRTPDGGRVRATVPTFAFLYGFFTFLHGWLIGFLVGAPTLRWYLVVLDKLTGEDTMFIVGDDHSVLAASPGGYLGMLAVYFLGQGLAFRGDWLRGGERDRLGRADVADFALGRAIVLHLCLICGFFLLGLTGTRMAVALLLIALKIALDVGLHFVRLARLRRS